MTWSVSTQKHSAAVRLHNLPADITAEGLAQFFWSRIGMNLGPESFDITHHGNCCSALVAVPRRVMADYLNRLLSEQLLNGKQIVVCAAFIKPAVRPDEGRENELNPLKAYDGRPCPRSGGQSG